MLTVYGRATSSNVQLVMWAIGELDLAHERLDYGEVFGGTDTGAYLAMNPHGRIPTLRDGDLVMWESGAILRYLGAVYGDGGAYWPADPAARARVDMWAEWAKCQLAPSFTVPVFWARVRTPAVRRDEARLARALERLEGYLGILDAQVAQAGYAAGAEFSAADVVAGHILFRYFDIDIERPDRPGLRDYYDRLSTRPAFREHVMVSYESLRADGA